MKVWSIRKGKLTSAKQDQNTRPARKCETRIPAVFVSAWLRGQLAATPTYDFAAVSDVPIMPAGTRYRG